MAWLRRSSLRSVCWKCLTSKLRHPLLPVPTMASSLNRDCVFGNYPKATQFFQEWPCCRCCCCWPNVLQCFAASFAAKFNFYCWYPPWNIRVTLGNLLFRYNSGDPTSISYKLQVRRQFTTKWKLELVQNGVSNFKIIQFGSKNARSGTHHVFPIRIPNNTIWCVSSFLIPW